MAEVQEPVRGVKRGSGRSSAAATPISKKPRLSATLQSSPAIQSPIVQTPLTEKRSSRLPWKISDNKPLPTLSKPQSPTLSNHEYQSIAASAVLQASLTRSQARWTCEGLFEKYWVKPETGKNARPPPPNNPDVKWMKHQGECRIRVEPHIFEAQMYVEERPRPPPPPKQYVAPQPAYAPQYRPGQPYTPTQQPYQNQTLPPINQQQSSRTLPPINSVAQRTPSAPAPPSRAQPGPSTGQQDKKTNPDPVISKLAARASSDPELKLLMKEVATGSATPEQLKIFQRHIDELQGQIKKEKETQEAREKAEEELRLKREAEAAAPAKTREEAIQYDGAADSKPNTPTPGGSQYQHPALPAGYTKTVIQPWAPPLPKKHAVILGFSIPGATENRFLFPENSILEVLTANHLLASFIITRRGRDAVDPTGLEPEKEYWQPVTLMIEVKYQLEELLECVKRWVKPAEEVRKYMDAVIKRCERAPESHLALRLPIKGSAAAAESEQVSKEGTPVLQVVEEKGKAKAKSNIKFVKKAPAAVSKTPTGTPTVGKKLGGDATSTPGAQGAALKTPDAPKAAAASENAAASGNAADGEKKDEAAATESGRPRRTVRKSVRISEG